MISDRRKKTPRLLALSLTWLVVLFYFVWGMVRNISLFTVVWRSFVIAIVVYVVVYYYLFWIVSRVPAEDKKSPGVES
ncbi:MAG TPA: hypothetical protein VLH40_09350 [Atribacteraceae bacterium]|nr:hypothetical protein [Atribacteraceae bacterium]